MRHSQWIAGSLLLLAAMAWAPPSRADAKGAAHADAKSAARADKLFEEGRAEADKGDYESACVKLRESQKLDPAVGTAYNLGNCEEHLGRLTVALALFKDVVKKTKADDERHAIAKGRADDLDKRIPWLVIVVPDGAPEGLKVKRDGDEVGHDALGGATPLDPGKHVIVIEAPGRKRRTVYIDLSEGEHRDFTATPGSEGEGDEAPETPLAPLRTAGWIAIGVGAASLVVSAITGGLTIAKKATVNSHCPGMVCDPTGFDAVSAGRTLGQVNLATFVVGAAGVGLGIGGVLIGGAGAPKDDKKPDTSLVPSVGPSGASLTLVHHF